MNLRTSQLVSDVTAARRSTHLLLAWVIVVGVGVIGSQALVQPLVAPLGSAGSPIYQFGEIATNAGTLLVILLWVVFWEKRSFLTVGLRDQKALARVGVGFLGGVAMFCIPLLVVWATGAYTDGASSHTSTGFSALPMVVALVPVWVVQATTEEIAIRGYLQQWHGWKQAPWPAILIPSLGFAATHLTFDPIAFTNIALAGALFALISLASGSIWLAAGLHIGWNMSQGNIFGIPVSGMAREVSLFAFGPVPGAPSWLTGGDFGLEGSLPATFVLIAAIIPAYLWFKKADAARQETTIPAPGWIKPEVAASK